MQWNSDCLVRLETIHQNDVKTKYFYWWNPNKTLAATITVLLKDFKNLANKDTIFERI